MGRRRRKDRASALAKAETRASLEDPQTSLANADDWLYEAFGAISTPAGVTVSRQTALTHSPFWRGVTLLSRDVGKLPFNVFRTVSNPDGQDGKERDRNHPASFLLRKRPNAYTTSGVFRTAMQMCALIEGNAYALIERVAGRPVSMLPLCGYEVVPAIESGVLRYMIRFPQDPRIVESMDILHIRGVSCDGWATSIE